MKKLRKVMAAVLVVCSLFTLLPFGASAADDGYIVGSRLGAFEDVAQMSRHTFSDVSSGSWYYSGVKTAYNKGIMLGYPDKSFGPDDNVTWAEAVTIVARIHASYNANRIAEPENDTWYGPYYRYCAARGLLPSGAPAENALSKNINRYDLAYMFSRVISSEDMPAINDGKIGDLANIPSYYRDSIKLLYASGIMQGTDSRNNFSGRTSTTRAQIATVIARVVEPALRIGSDARINADMAEYEANLENDSVMVQVGKESFCLYKNYETVDTVSYSLLKVDAADKSTKLYTASIGQYLENISTYDGKVYFTCNTSGTSTGRLMCYDPEEKTLSTVYEGFIIESYCFYDGGLYALAFTNYADKPEGYAYAFGTIANGTFVAAVSDLPYSKVMNFVPYGWNGKIYFKFSEIVTVKDEEGVESEVSVDKLHAYDIASGTISKVCNYMINTSFFEGHVMYFMAYDTDGNYDLNMYAISVEAPGAVTMIGTFPTATNTRNRSVYKFDDTFYCLASFNRNVYSMDETGSTRLELICGGVYDSMNFTADKMVLIPNTLVTSNANELKVYNSRTLAARSLYGDWLGQSVYYKGARFVPEDGKGYVTSDMNVSTVTDLSIVVTKGFTRGSDFIVQAKYTNNTASDITLRSYIVKVYLDGELVAYDLNRMVGLDMKQYDVQSFTFVIAGADVLKDFDINDGHIAIEIVPTFDVIVVDTTTTA